jgi:hypothetical protein
VAESNHEAEDVEAATDPAAPPISVPADGVDIRSAR